ncbi:MAG TPA: glycine cleavage system aminomethyltransferase GcvT [Bacteroidales bacterium]|nr:glycine cleavage system aminomethyltransferase GcvT [Bacteroidales bacterium]
MKTTALKDRHEAMGGKMVPFAGFYMPVQFEGVNIEHETVRTALGVFDVSHMGEIWVEGPAALDLIQRISSNDAALLTDGKVQYACFPNFMGGIVDDFLVYRFHAEKYLLVVNASNIEKDWEWVNAQNEKIGAIVRNASDEISQLAVQGPLALKAIQKLTETPIVDMPYYTFKTVQLAGVEQVILSTTGYTGAGGCELYFENKYAESIYEAVLEAGKEFGIKPIGLAARDTLRLEMGFCLYGHEINDTTSPIEAGLGWITKFSEGKNMINRDALLKQKNQGVDRKLVGFKMLDKGIPRQHYPILDSNAAVIGEVTSGTMSPMLKEAIGMGYVKTEFASIGSTIYVDIRGKSLEAEIVKLPFYKQP